ncbi:short chain dehydrogenase [Pseudomonas sp. PDM31]|uniref:short chain dehydrogenase n=1 Tax=Pseudomonas sp. PDM31 TaxID=2854778 RepID=UPI001C472317|nr:short chain dehydrogenase [Pseudomonas sp. PDM31]
MIDQATGMRPGERYSVESRERTPHFPGFFLDGKYYLGPELQTAVGWLEGRQFLYDQLDPGGEPVYPGRVAGTIENLTLILGDGARLQLHLMEYESQQSLPYYATDEIVRNAVDTFELETDTPKPAPIRPSALLVVGAALLVSGALLALNRLGRRRSGP